MKLYFAQGEAPIGLSDGMNEYGFVAPEGYVVVSGGYELELNGGSAQVVTDSVMFGDPLYGEPASSSYVLRAVADTTGGVPTLAYHYVMVYKTDVELSPYVVIR